jgi:hypothetical protein
MAFGAPWVSCGNLFAAAQLLETSDATARKLEAVGGATLQSSNHVFRSTAKYGRPTPRDSSGFTRPRVPPMSWYMVAHKCAQSEGTLLYRSGSSTSTFTRTNGRQGRVRTPARHLLSVSFCCGPCMSTNLACGALFWKVKLLTLPFASAADEITIEIIGIGKRTGGDLDQETEKKGNTRLSHLHFMENFA